MIKQPPSGGCVLKPGSSGRVYSNKAAAFGRLCVETKSLTGKKSKTTQPPSGGCVLKQKSITQHLRYLKAAAFGRLCVETIS